MQKLTTFDTFEAGIVFYALVNQFKRVADKIEAAHDQALTKNCSSIKFKETIAYYQKEKALVLGMMKDLFDEASTTKEVENGEEK